MPLRLPRTVGCLVCGRDNPIGLNLAQFVEEDGSVTVTFTPAIEHIGFQGVVHGGILATVLDEAMVWAATWFRLRFCLAAELTVRYRVPAQVGQELTVVARQVGARGRLITTSAQIAFGSTVVAESTGKYITLGDAENRAFVNTLVQEEESQAAFARLRDAAV